MSLYLHVRAGDYHLLLSAERVLEIWPRRREEPPGRWRARDLPALDLRKILQTVGEGEAVNVAYGPAQDDNDVIVLTLDGVAGLMNLAEDALTILPAVSRRAMALFDAVTRNPIGTRHLLRLRLQPDFAALAAG